MQLDQLIQPLQTRCPSAFGGEYRLRVSAISIYCRTEGNCDGSSGTPTGTEGRHRPSGARPRKVGKRSNPFVRVRWCGCLISVRLDRCCRRGRMTGCHPERPVVVSRANRSRRPQAVIQVSLKNGPVMPHIRVFRRWMRGIIWISSTVHAFRVCKACRAGSRLVAASGRAISCVCQDWFQGRLQAIIICSHARRGLVRVPRAALRVTRDRASRFNPVPLRPGQEAR